MLIGNAVLVSLVTFSTKFIEQLFILRMESVAIILIPTLFILLFLTTVTSQNISKCLCIE